MSLEAWGEWRTHHALVKFFAQERIDPNIGSGERRCRPHRIELPDLNADCAQ
jgi:hypothetical protein